jgi:DNA-binding beta-propeller fold protein YncE
MHPCKATLALAASCLAAALLGPCTAAAVTTLVQKPGAAGCLSSIPGAACGAARGLDGARGAAISPDGANVYIASDFGDALVVLDRSADGTLSQQAGAAGCVADTGSAGCADGSALDGGQDVALSPDGSSVYLATYSSHAVAVFDRGAGGALTQKAGAAGCIASYGPPQCASGHDFGPLAAVAVSPDGTSVYAATHINNGVVAFDRAPDGTLTQKAGVAGCVTEAPTPACTDGRALSGADGLAMSADGRSVYVSASSSNAVAVFDRAADGTLTQKAGVAGCLSQDAAGCAYAKAMGLPTSLALSPDDRSLYVSAAGSAAVAAFDRAPDGTLTQKAGPAGCVSSLPSGGACATGTLLGAASSLEVSRDGANVYMTTSPSINFLVPDGALAVFDRAADGTLAQLPGQAGCIYEGVDDQRCVRGRFLARASAVAISADSAHAYVASSFGNAVAVFDKGAFIAPPPSPPPPPPAPVLRGLQLSPASFRALRRGPSIVARGGSRVSFSLSAPAMVSFGVEQVVAGRRVGGRCRAPRRSNRSATRCDRFRTLRGSFALGQAAAGRNTVRFSGRLGSHVLAPGRYRLRAMARNAVTLAASPAKVARFSIRRP